MQTSYEIYLDLSDSGVDVEHKDLIRTVERLLSHGLEDEIIESEFTNKMGRSYKMYILSDRVVNMIECIYLFKGYGDNKTKKVIANYSNPDITYIFSSSNGMFKIGCTNNIQQRLAAIQVGNPNFIEVYATLYGGKEIEKKLHEQLAEHRVSGEWFRIDEEIIHNIREENRAIFKYHDTLGSLLSYLFLEISKEDDKEYLIEDFTNSKNPKVLKRLKRTIEDGMNRQLPYKEIYKYAKEEVEKLSDSLAFKKIN